MSKPSVFEAILGTYEEFLVGYKFNPDSEEFVQSFAAHSHSNSVRCITFSDYYLASGGADDRIVVFDLRSRKEHCMLTHHSATVNCLQFTPEHTHLISGSADGVLAITRVGNWQLEKIWEKAHDGEAIIDIAVHQSGTLALTLGADAKLRTWDLIKGRRAYVINLNSKCKNPKLLQSIKWAPDGIHFVLSGGFTSDIWSIETGGINTKIENVDRVSSCIFLDDATLVVGFENGNIATFNTAGIRQKQIKAHSTRVKSMDVQGNYLVSCSSDGEIKLWDCNLKEMVSCNSGCRHTCVLLVPPIKVKIEENDDEALIAENDSTQQQKPRKISKARVRIVIEDDGTKCTRKRQKLEEAPTIEMTEKNMKKKKKKLQWKDNNLNFS